MYHIKVNNKFDYELSAEKGAWKINGVDTVLDTFEIKQNTLHVLHQHQSYQVEIVDFSKVEKTAQIKVNGRIYSISIKDQFDDLLKALGLDNLQSNKVAELKAPMPGLVLNMLVKEGDKVNKGDNLFVLEAMKMENIIKAPADVEVKSIKIKPGDKVEKNQLLMVFG